jgi:hypothetical protein
MSTRYSEPHALLRMHERHVTQEEVQQALWTRREHHPPHRDRPGSFWAPIAGRDLAVLYRRLDGDDFVITVCPRHC